MGTKILAHRGASAYYPENTMEAFEAAVQQGADGFELDVHLSKDGHVVVFHDASLERVSNGKGLVVEYTLSELKQLEVSGCRIPTLSEVYELAAAKGMFVNVELKTAQPLYPEMPEKLLQLEAEHKMEEQVLYSSFNHYVLKELQALKPSVKTGLLYDCGLVDPWVYAKYVKADAIHPYHYIIEALPETVANCHKAGIMVNSWTVDEPQIMQQHFKLGVDMLITNKPDVAVKEKGREI